MIEFLAEILSPGHPFAICLAIFYMVFPPAVFISWLVVIYWEWKRILYS